MKPRLPRFAGWVLLIWPLWALVLPAQNSSGKPNVLFIAVDDLNDWVGFMGGYPGEVHTPNMDRLAARGTAFLNAHTASPVCCPSRVAALSGQLPSTSGIYNNRQWWKPAQPGLVTIPAHFRKNGYTTAGAGKIFHHQTGHNPPQLWDRFKPLRFRDNAFAYDNLEAYGLPGPTDIPPGFPFSGVSLYSKEVDWGALDKPEAAFDDAITAQFCIDFLKQNQDRPFFLACGIFRPHLPWYIPKKYLELYPLNKVHVPEDLPRDLDDIPQPGKKLALRKYKDMEKTRDAGKWPTAIRHYLASISFADAQIGRLLEALGSSPHRDNTLIVLWSDHGWHLGEKQHWHKRTLWEEATRVPLIVVDPRLKKGGQASRQPASTLDIFPTLLDLCELPPPGQKLDGVSLVPWLREPDKPGRPAVITVDENRHVAVRSERYRYIRYSDGSEEFYDHLTDPKEWNNQIGNLEYAEEIRLLKSRLPVENAPVAKENRDFDFNPATYAWTDKATGETISGR